MTTVVVLGTGPSLTVEQVKVVRDAREEGRCKVVAVSDSYRLAPWADALVSHDANWWWQHPQALEFSGPCYCGGVKSGTECLPPQGPYPTDCNSGLQGMRVAHEKLGAALIVLLGFDMRGSHFFGAHPHPLPNTTDARFAAHLRQFKKWRGCRVINCTPGSALTQFEMGNLNEVLRS